MITVNHDHIEISLPVCAALLAFASKDATRPHLGVGLDTSAGLCATDGQRAVAFLLEPAFPAVLHGKVWARSVVETAFKVAKAQKATTVVLPVAAACQDHAFPPIAQVIPDRLITARAPVGFDPALLFGALEATCKACGVKGAKLDSLADPLDPIAFTVNGPSQSARVVVMPMRI